MPRPTMRSMRGATPRPRTFSAPLPCWWAAGLALALSAAPRPIAAQSHALYREDAPPGAIGQLQQAMHPGMYGYVQPVRLLIPEGAEIACWDGQAFQPLDAAAGETIGLQVGQVRPLRLSHLPQHEGVELFPTLELINRLYPPEGQAEQFPVLVEIPLDDLRQAIEGKLVTRVVYLEDPDTAMPYRQSAVDQPYFDVHPADDVLQVASRLGRPMAIVRMGSRVPDEVLDRAGPPAAAAISIRSGVAR